MGSVSPATIEAIKIKFGDFLPGKIFANLIKIFSNLRLTCNFASEKFVKTSICRIKLIIW
ncbi:hypothetical protein COV82_04035 [Candidatus Peregrinibacteria bacterium CG11_big_fil_rev_8_21_14_0_20_46_8]|nr:MAG: hypothetical protein COV82_04035 [Candidatus Peregrinibacteria bacterium CG11_big_fil_rev_8_21_14_0_20_46_8]